jgi:hypothetical protein
MTIIQEFIESLSIEIDALKKGKGGSLITVYNGQLIRENHGLFIYQFTLESFLVALDDTPANIEVNGKEFDCDIISVTGQKVQISVNQEIGKVIPSAKIKTNTWYLLERLKNKLEDNLGSQLRFENSNKLFQYQKSKIDDGIFQPTYSINGFEPNSSQKKAIESSVNDFVSIIWGPPGTGKTETIAKAIESHLNLDRKVLLLSHANNAVDQALIKVANQMKETSYYKEGQLIRLGTPKAEMGDKIKGECPLVLSEEIVKEKSTALNIEKENLNQQLETLRRKKQSFKFILSTQDQIKNVNKKLEELSREQKNKELKIISLKDHITKTRNEISDLKKKLAKAQDSGALKKFFLGLNPEQIEKKIKRNSYELKNKLNNEDDLNEQINSLKQTIKSVVSKKNVGEATLSKQLSKINKSIEEVHNEFNVLGNEEEGIKNRLDEVNKAIEEIKIKVFRDAKLVATTLTKSYISREIEFIDFDILIVDEVSMAPMPMLYWAASKVKKGITIVGDFNQLPPICISNDDLAQKWLGRSIFDELDIKIDNAKQLTSLLKTQYRMHPAISEIPNKKMYGGLLEDGDKVQSNFISDSVSGESAICLIDTSPHNPWCSQFESGGRFNLINALICSSLAEIISKSLAHDESIGIITPYRNQARLIHKIIEDSPISQNIDIRINTVHSFQGGDETVIIFDSLEGEGAKKWSMINEYDNTESAKLLLNVALTRAEKKLYIVANNDYLHSTFENSAWFIDILKHFRSKGKVVKSTEIISDLRDENFDFWIEKLNSLKNRPENFGLQYNEEEFWPSFHNDLANANNEVIIFSPFLTKERFGKLHLIFTELLSKGIQVYLITLPPNQHPSVMENPTSVIMKLKEMGVTVKFRHNMHEKIAIIDRKVEWSGSLNILSHNKRKEYMKRIEGENSAKEVFDKFNLQELLIEENINGELCPNCSKSGITHFIVPKYSYRNNQFFYGCSGYRESDCKFTTNISTRSIDKVEVNTNKSNKTLKATKRNKNSNQSSTTSANQQEDLFGNPINGRQWETKLCYWSSVKLPGYRYSKKKKAWWKSKK